MIESEAHLSPSPVEIHTDVNEFIPKQSRLIVDLDGDITEDRANKVIKSIYDASWDNPEKTIVLRIHTDGGSIEDAMAIINAMQESPNDIYTFGESRVQSAGLAVLAYGDIGKRFVRPYTKLMGHDITIPAGSRSRVKEDKKRISVYETQRAKFIDMFLQRAKMPEKILNIFEADSDTYLTPEEVIQIGLADFIYAPTPNRNKPKLQSNALNVGQEICLVD